MPLTLDYSASTVPVRDDLRDAHARILEHLRGPGNWFSGAQRLAIAAESRNAARCRLCRERKGAVSPAAVTGSHDALSDLPESLIDVAHRVRSDPARLSRRWFEETLDAGLSDAEYVEAVGVVTLLAGADYFCRALGIPVFPLPEPLPGEPSRQRPLAAKPGSAWVPMIAPEDAEGPESDLYPEAPMIPNIMRALSLVPDHARTLQTSSNAHYVAVESIADPTVRRDLDRLQMELVASRVSALNECFY
jgi:alkylhydroperoxidase family enzyme